MTVHYFGTSESYIGSNALIEQVVIQKVSIVGPCIMGYSCDISVLGGKKSVTKVINCVRPAEYHFPLTTIFARFMLKLRFLFAPFIA